MHFEESRQERAGVVREMRACPALDLGKVRLAEGRAELALNGAGDFELAHLTAEATEVAFDRAERADLLAKRHCN